MTKYKCIIWDWNGTLLDDLDVCVSVMNRILKNRKLPLLSIEKYKEIFSFPVKHYYNQLGFDFAKEPFEKISEEFVNDYQKESLSADLYENCITILETVRSLGIIQIILSASQLEKLEEQVNHFGIYDYFVMLLGLDHIHATSKVEIGKRWIERSGFKREEVLLVGDTLHDYEVAGEIGCDCILLSCGHQNRERILSAGVPVIESLMEIKDYLCPQER